MTLRCEVSVITGHILDLHLVRQGPLWVDESNGSMLFLKLHTELYLQDRQHGVANMDRDRLKHINRSTHKRILQ